MSAKEPEPADTVEEEEDQYIEADEIFEEVDDSEDPPMDEDDEDAGHDGGGDPMGDVVWEDNSIQHFPTHEKSVFAVSTHPTQPIAASGGEDDLGYLWNIDNGEVIVKLTGHTDSVTSTAFSADGEYVATGGMDGRARVWRRHGKENYNTWEFVTDLQGPDEVMVRFISSSISFPVF